MSLENYEGTAIDTSMFKDDVQPNTDPETNDDSTIIDDVDPQNSDGLDVDNGGEPNEENQIPSEFDIDGIGKVTADEIKEWRNSGLRQSDYTKKTQELAREREQHKEAVELFDYLRSNPHLIAKLKEIEETVDPTKINVATPEYGMMRDLARQQKSMELDLKMNSLKEKYGDIDEIAVYSKATELKTDDLEFVWKGIMADNFDERSIIERAKSEIQAEIQKNKKATSTIVGTKQSTNNMAKPIRTLSDAERRVAEGMGLTDAEYLKWSE